MPLAINVSVSSGCTTNVIHFEKRNSYTAGKLKLRLGRALSVKPSHLILTTVDGAYLEDENLLIEFAEISCFRPSAEVTLHATFVVCWQCGKANPKRCSGCRLARYCSRECQWQDWPDHRAQCRLWSCGQEEEQTESDEEEKEEGEEEANEVAEGAGK